MSAFEEIAEKVERGERLSREDGITLMTAPEVLRIGQAAGGDATASARAGASRRGASG